MIDHNRRYSIMIDWYWLIGIFKIHQVIKYYCEKNLLIYISINVIRCIWIKF